MTDALPATTAATGAAEASTTNPYVGPRTFTFAQRDFFFGRARAARDLAARVVSERLLLFYAQSGAGKSSLLNTRIIPQLRDEEGFAVLPVGRVSGHLPAGVTAVDNIYLFNLMASIDPGDPARLAHLALNDFLNRLVSDDGETWQYDAAANAVTRAAATAARATTGQRYLLIIDQFEEIVTAHPDRWPERSDFFRQLNQVLRDNRDLWVLLTLREDYVASLDPFAPLVDGKLQGRFYMERMDVNGALAAVQEPPRLAGRPFAPGVAEQLVDDLRRVQIGVPGPDGSPPPTALGDYVEPVQLQIVCFGLWNRLPPGDRPIWMEDYRAFGNVDQALTNFYEDGLARVSRDGGVSERQARAWFEAQLITPARTRGLVYRGAETTAGLPNAAVDQLADIYLIRAEVRGGNRYYELAHDRLLEPVQTANRRWLERYDNPLVTPTRNWLAAGRDPTRLLDGLQLEQARTYAAGNAKELLTEEQEFLAESAREQEARRKAAAARARQRRILAISGVVIGLLLLALTLWALRNAQEAEYQRQEAETQRNQAQQERDRAVTAEANTLRNESRRLANLALQQIDIDPLAALNLSLVALPDPQLPPAQRRPLVPEAEAALWQALHSSAERKYVPISIYEPAQVAVGAQGIVVAEGAVDKPSLIHTYDFDLNELTTVPVTTTSNALRGVRWGKDGKVLAYDAENAIVWQGTQQIAARQLLTSTTRAPYLSCAEWRPRHNQVVACTDRGIVLWSPTRNDTPESILVATGLLVSDTVDIPLGAAWSPSGDWLAAWGERLVLVDARSEQPPVELPTDSAIVGLQFITPTTSAGPGTEPAAERLLVWGDDGQTRLWSTAGELLRTYDEQCDDDCVVNGALLSPDGQQLLTYMDTGAASLWNFASGERTASLVGHTASILAAAWYNQYVATASVDGTVQVWDAASGESVVTLRGHRPGERVLGVHWLEDGRLLTFSQAEGAFAALPGSLRLWQIFDEDQEPLCRQADIPRCHVMSQALVDPGAGDTFSALRWLDDSTLITTRQDGTAARWDLRSGEAVTLSGSGEQPNTVVWNPTGDGLLSYAQDGPGELWQIGPQGWVAAGELAGPVRNARWLPVGLVIDTGTSVALWNTKTDKPTLSLGDAYLVDALQPTTDTLIVATGDGLLRQWDLEQGSQLATLEPASQSRAHHLEASADGQTLLAITSQAFSETVTLWSLQTGQRTWSWPLPTATLDWSSASLSPDRRYVTVVQDGSLYLLDLLAPDPAQPVVWKDEAVGVLAATWNKDGSRFLTWEFDPVQGKGVARLWQWDAARNVATQILQAGHGGLSAGPLLDETETQLLTEDADHTLRIWQIWPNVEGLITAAAECCVTRGLSEQQRKEFVIDYPESR